ncbi:hypothetical protein G6F32_008422 [Rhizopus arrhizus]|nr:hypothetical protein G6F32_008422 [Rhizopus arrhizus]
MGLPVWKPKRRSLDEIQEDIRKQHQSLYGRNIGQLSTTERIPVITSHNNSNVSTSTEFALLQPHNRISRRRNIMTSSFTERRQNQSSSDNSPIQQDELDHRIEQFISEKRDLLEQLQVTGFLLEQFLTARTRLGADTANVPEFITQDLPNILESAATLAAMSPSELVFPFSSSDVNTNMYGQSMVEALLSIPPYSTQIQDVETNILSAHRRIRRQLRSLAAARQSRRQSPTLSSASSSPSRSSPPFHSSSSSPFRSLSARRRDNISRRIRFADREASP